MASFKFDRDDIRHHLQMQQNIINRMAKNSANCKTWLLTIVTALTALQISRNSLVSHEWLFPILILVFWYLDSFYLCLEGRHIQNEEKFVNFVHGLNVDNDKFEIPQIYHFSTLDDKGKKHYFCDALKAMGSQSTLPFYLFLIAFSIILLYSSCIFH